MRILYITNSRIPTEKAHGLQIMKTIEALILQGDEVKLLVPKRRNPITLSSKEFYGLKTVPQIIHIPNYFALLETPFHDLYFILQRVSFGLTAFLYGLFSLEDIIYSREITLSFFLSFFGKKVVYEDHEPKGRFRFLYLFFIKHIWRKVIVPENLTELYKKFGVQKDSYIVAPNGVDLREFDVVRSNREVWKKLGLTGSEKVVLYIGHFYRWKGIYTLLDASPFITLTKIVLIGGTEIDRDTILKYVNEKKYQNVIIHPFILHNEVIEFIKSADVLVLPNTAKEERSQKYTTPIKLFEYMVSGVPIVASRIPSLTIYLKDEVNALLVNPDDPADLAKKINQILLSPDLSEHLYLEAFKKVAEHSWISRIKRIRNFMQ